MDTAMKVEPDAAGMRQDRLERITEHFGPNYVDTGKIAGCQITVVRGGHVAYARSLGLMDREQAVPMSDDAIFRIYSMTKPIVSVALMQLYERGEFQLLDPVHRFIPEWRTLQVGRDAGRRHHLADQAAAADEHARRPHAHHRASRQPLPGQSGRRSVRRGAARVGAGPDARERHRPVGRAPAQVPPRHALELRAVHRHRRSARRDPLGPATRRLPARRALRPARHDRHRVLRPRRRRSRASPPATSTARPTRLA